MSSGAVGELLGKLNAVPGVIGSMVAGDHGEVLASAFPPHVDPAAPVRAARVLADHAAGLEAIGGPVSTFAVRFANGRLLVRPFGSRQLLVYFASTVNPQPLALLVAATAPKLARLLEGPPPIPPPAIAAPAPPAAPAPAPPPPGQLFLLVQRIEAVIARKRLDPFRTRGAISMGAGFGLRAIDETTPDDPGMLARLEAAAAAVLGEQP